MLFSSPAFFAFFAVYFLFHLALPARYRVFLIIAGSTIFYAWWKVEYAWLPYLLMAISYGGVLAMERATAVLSVGGGGELMMGAAPPGPGQRKAVAIAAIAALFVPLLVFKYTDFFYRDVLGPVFGWHGTLLNVSLPLGVSFVTFTLTAYVVDIYTGRFPAQHKASTV